MQTQVKKYQPFDGKVAVVTGSGRGIGKAIAASLAANGAIVVLNGRDSNRLAMAEGEIRKISSDVSGICCDISSPSGGRFLIDETIRMHGKLDILVNTVGVSMRGNFADLDPQVFRMMFESNVYSAVNVSIPAVMHLRKTMGSMVFISSVAGIRGLPFVSAYCSSKMALRALAESVRIEEKEHGLHVGLIYVGYTENDAGKETVAADGTKILLKPRTGRGLLSKETVAEAVIQNIRRRKFITTLSVLGKLNVTLQPLFPSFVEMLLIKNIARFRERCN